MYSEINFRTKKALKGAVKSGQKIRAFQPGPFPGTVNGPAVIEGPHYPEPHRWYASVVLEDSYIIKVTG
jgi:hypothetical protein